VAADLLTSHRGIGGGFALAPATRGATMLEAVEAIDGPIALNTCLSPDTPCPRASFCPAHFVWHEAQVRVADVLRGATIGALAERAGGAAPVHRPGRVA
jgi:DNA-binding IscR family transcriptional regulator